MAVTNPFSLFIEKLSKKLKGTLPGETAHQVMEISSPLKFIFEPNEQTRKSAVLILFYPFRNEIYFPLILRPTYNGVHSGQIAFPGGRYELTDESLLHTALREAQEEIGLKIDDVKVVGQLTELFIGPSNFLVLPVVGYIPYRPDFIADIREVAEILEVTLDYISNPKIMGASEILIRNEQLLTPHYNVAGHKVWGATAKMISELLLVINACLPETKN